MKSGVAIPSSPFTAETVESAHHRPSWLRGLYGWRRNLSLGTLFVLLIFILNVSLICWTALRPQNEDGTYTVFEGSCSATKWVNSMGHLGINIASCVIYMATNTAMQCLTAPPRAVVNAEHGNRRDVEIGVHSWKNLRLLSKGKLLIYLLLGASSILLHTFYNSVISESFSTNDYFTILVRPSFLEGEAWYLPPCFPDDFNAATDTLLYLQNHIESFRKVTNDECLRGYYSSSLVSQWANVLFVTEPDTGNPVLNADAHLTKLDKINGNPWVYCEATGINCELSYLVSHPDELEYRGCPYQYLPDDDDWGLSPFPVSYCMVEEVEEKCSVRMSLTILIVVAACNLIKIICMLSVLKLKSFHPLITIGDAIASFLDNRDLSTSGCGLHGVESIPAWQAGLSWSTRIPRSTPDFRRRRWFRGTRLKRFIVSSFLLFALTGGLLGLFIGLFPFLWYHDGQSLPAIVSYGFGQFKGALGIEITPGSLLILSLAANSLQIGLSLAYLLYNDLLTRMMVSREWFSYSMHRKGLRVSRPVGQQRSTYFLQLPLRYSLPLMTVFALSHWVLSESFFVVLVKELDYTGMPTIVDKGFSTASLSWSPLAMMIMIIIGGVLLLGFWTVSWFKKYPPTGMPLAQSSSVCISSACHAPAGDENAATKRVQWGEVGEKDARGVGHACFTSEQVTPVVEGEIYA